MQGPLEFELGTPHSLLVKKEPGILISSGLMISSFIDNPNSIYCGLRRSQRENLYTLYQFNSMYKLRYLTLHITLVNYNSWWKFPELYLDYTTLRIGERQEMEQVWPSFRLFLGMDMFSLFSNFIIFFRQGELFQKWLDVGKAEG